MCSMPTSCWDQVPDAALIRSRQQQSSLDVPSSDYLISLAPSTSQLD